MSTYTHARVWTYVFTEHLTHTRVCGRMCSLLLGLSPGVELLGPMAALCLAN